MLDASYLNKNFLKTGPKYYHSDVITVCGFICTPRLFFHKSVHAHSYVIFKKSGIVYVMFVNISCVFTYSTTLF